MEGWIKSYRAMLDNPVICKDAEHYAVWGYILHRAMNEDGVSVVFGGKRITLCRGQLITTRKKIAQHFNISESKVNRILKLFENEKQIEQQSSNLNTLISICNWDVYQSGEKQNEKQVKNEWKTSEKRVKNINKKDKKDNNIHTHSNNISCNNLIARAHVHTHTRERETASAGTLLDWLAERFPQFGQMNEPLTPEQAQWISANYRTDDIQRVFASMASKQVWNTHANTFAAFTAYAACDYSIKERTAARTKLYTYGEMCDMIGKGYSSRDFVSVKAMDGRVLWHLATDINT